MLEGGCYCGALRYRVEGAPMRAGECLCRECQYHSGGGPNFLMVFAADGFSWTAGTPASFRRDPVRMGVTRDFCGACGTQILSRVDGRQDVIIKAGTLDDPSVFGEPAFAIFACDRQPFHVVAEGVPVFERMPQG